MNITQQKTTTVINRKIKILIYQKDSIAQIMPTKKHTRGKKISNLSILCTLLKYTSMYMPQDNL